MKAPATIEIEGETFYRVCAVCAPKGKTPLTAELLSSIAANYDPDNRHEAPLWKGHLHFEEPEAEGWVKRLMFAYSSLYASFKELSEEIITKFALGRFKRMSIEIPPMDFPDGFNGNYLFAIGTTNRPAVSGLEWMKLYTGGAEKFKEREHFCYSDNISEETLYEFDVDFSKPKFSNTMNEYLVKVAKGLGIDAANYTTEAALTEAVEAKQKEQATQLSRLNELEEKSKHAEAYTLVENAVKEKKILPKDKEHYTTLAKSNLEATKAVIGGMSASTSLTKGLVTKEFAAPEDDTDKDKEKFTTSDGKKLTYSSFLEEVKNNPGFADKFTAEEIDNLKKAEPGFYKKK